MTDRVLMKGNEALAEAALSLIHIYCSTRTRLPHGSLSFCLHREREAFGPFPCHACRSLFIGVQKPIVHSFACTAEEGMCIARSFRPDASGS